METAKVDIKKLQVLSDRINQCIDALNQVRISVHGLSQSSPFTSGGASALGAQGFGQIPGLSHTSPFGMSNPFNNPYAGIGGAAGIGQQPFLGQQSPFLGQPFGLSHTGPEATDPYAGATWSDPYLAAKVTQTFPYLRFAVPPVVSLY
jgi:hypothetical protein